MIYIMMLKSISLDEFICILYRERETVKQRSTNNRLRGMRTINM